MTNRRQQIIDRLVIECSDDVVIKSDLLFVALLGSTQTDEAVEGYSDLDVLFILKSDKSGGVNVNILRQLQIISEKLSRDNKVEISLLTHTVFDFEEYVDFEYLTHYSWGKVVFGSKEAYVGLFLPIIKRKLSEKRRRNLIYYNLIHARFNFIRRYVSWNRFNKSEYTKAILKLTIDTVIEMCDWALIYRGIFNRTKLGIINGFANEFRLSVHQDIPSMAYEVRKNWLANKFTESELHNFIDEAVLFIQELVRIIHEEHTSN